MKPQRYLAAAGFGSRRVCEKLILDGRATVNGSQMTFNMIISPDDKVVVDGKPVTANDQNIYIALNKPAGYISDRGIPHEKSALDLVDVPQRLFAVGRLDKDATGLLLLTNDGDTTYRLTHPRFEHEKEYRVLVEGKPNADTLLQWSSGVQLNDEITAPAQVQIMDEQNSASDTSWLKIIMHEGRKRQIKRVAKLLGHPVRQLIRVRIGAIMLGNLKPGTWRQLTTAEVFELNRSSV